MNTTYKDRRDKLELDLTVEQLSRLKLITNPTNIAWDPPTGEHIYLNFFLRDRSKELYTGKKFKKFTGFKLN